MTDVVVAHTNIEDSHRAGLSLGLQLAEAMDTKPDVVIVFLSPIYEYPIFLQALKKACHPTILIGCSSSSAFTSYVQGEATCALALHSTEMQFRVSVRRDVHEHPCGAAQTLAASFSPHEEARYPYRSALLLTDGLIDSTEDFLKHLTLCCGGTHQFFGAASGDHAQMLATPVFCDTEVLCDAVVALEIVSKKPLGIGVHHGWIASEDEMFLTHVEGKHLVSVDDRPAAEVFKKFVSTLGKTFDPRHLLPTVFGIDTQDGYTLRMPLLVEPDGSILCTADLPAHGTLRFPSCTPTSLTQATRNATVDALQHLYGSEPAGALFFTCPITRQSRKDDFSPELQALRASLGSALYAGCNSHGQIIRAEGQFNGFLNCTAAVCLFPR